MFKAQRKMWYVLRVTIAAVVIASLMCTSAFASPQENDASGDHLGAGMGSAEVLDITFEEACEMAGVDPLSLGDSSVTEEKLSVRSLKPSKYRTLMEYAMQYRGWSYLWAGKYPSQGGFDCSGLVTWCYDKALGATIDGWYTNASRLYADYCKVVPASEAKPGDLVFWRGTYGSDVDYISHVGIYCGGDICYAAGDPIGFYRISSLRNIHGDRAQFFFGSLREVDDGTVDASDGIIMHRVYNPNSGEHFYTASAQERDVLMSRGWRYENIGWIAPSYSNTPVYRLYSGTDHHYTRSAAERDSLVRAGWRYEGIGWYSADEHGTPLYRHFNPNVQPWAPSNNAGSHHYTSSRAESSALTRAGWHDEGVGWYGL